MTLPERLRIIRGQLGQVEFAKKIGSSQTGVSAYEKGQRKPDYETLIRVSQEFGVTLDWLLLGTGPMYKTSDEATKGGTGNTLPVFSSSEAVQSIENITSKKKETGNTLPVPPLTNETQELYRKMLGLQERLLALTEQNAELRITLERAQQDIDRRNQRIRELEEENARLREARKGPSPVFRAATGEAN